MVASLQRWPIAHPWLALGLTVLASALLGAGTFQLRFDLSTEANFIQGDPSLEVYERFKKEFGSDETVLIQVECPDAFTEPHTSRLLTLGRTLRSLSFVEELRSPLHSSYCAEIDGAIHIRSVEDAAPKNADERARERARVLGYTPFHGVLIDPQGRHVSFMLRIAGGDTSPKFRAFVSDQLEAVLSAGPWRDYPHAAVGVAINVTRFGRILVRESGLALVLGLGIAGLAFVVLVRSLRPVLAVFVIVLLTLVATLGAGGLLGLPLSMFSAIIVILLICVGIADPMHVITNLEIRLRAGEDFDEAYAEALQSTWKPCVLTSATTAAGFLALCSSGLAPVRNLGALAAFGCVSTFLIMLGVLPSFLRGWSPRASDGEPSVRLGRRADWSAVCLAALAAFIERRHRAVLLLSFALTAGFAVGWGRVEVNNEFLPILPRDSELRRSLEFVESRGQGTAAVQVVIDTGVPEGAKTAGFLQRVDAFETWLRQAHPMVENVESLPDAIRPMHALFSGDAPRVPDGDDAVAQLIEFCVDPVFVDSFVVDQGKVLRIVVRCRSEGSREYSRLLDSIEDELARRFPAAKERSITGGVMLLKRLEDYILQTQLESFGLALLLVSLLVGWQAGSLRLAVISLVPNLVPVVCTIGIMGWLGLPLDSTNVLVSTLALGIVVDDTIHFIHAYRRELQRESPRVAVLRAHEHAGRAILFSSLVLIGAFGSYTVSSDMRNVQSFGFLVSVTFLAALLTDLILLPALLFAAAAAAGDAPTPG